MDSWFREIHVPRAWRVHLATGFDFHEKNGACFGSIAVPTLASVSYLVTILLGRKVNGDHFFRNFVYVLRTTTAHHMVSFISIFTYVAHTVSLGYLCVGLAILVGLNASTVAFIEI